ncbi:zinc finger in N-recognin protein [Toxoplasma gondii MAS]|nr:zinc finger in N-recognin protein [Toxoplasma gondii MAS]
MCRSPFSRPVFLSLRRLLRRLTFPDLSEHPANVAALWDDGFLPLYCLSQNVNLHRRRTTTHVEYEDSHRWSHSLCLAIELGQNALALHEILEACPWPVAVLIFQKTRQRMQAWVGATRRRECVEEGVHWVFASGGGVASLLDRERNRERNRERRRLGRRRRLETGADETEEARQTASVSARRSRTAEQGRGGAQSGEQRGEGEKRREGNLAWLRNGRPVYPERRSADHCVSRHPTSFHVPLSRLFAQLLKALMTHRECPVQTLEELLELLGLSLEDTMEALEHHLRTLVLFHQVTTCSMWVRNG